MNLLHAAQTTPSLTSRGLLQVNVVSIQNNFPVTDATISISSKNNPETIIEQVSVNSSGQTEQISLPAPPLDYSFDPNAPTPYSECGFCRSSWFSPSYCKRHGNSSRLYRHPADPYDAGKPAWGTVPHYHP